MASPFGFRKRVRTWLGTERTTDITYHTITYVLPDGTEKVVKAEDRYTILMASQALPAPMGTGRRAGGTCPDGKCTLCKIQIIDGTGLSQQTDAERASMQAAREGKPHEGRPREPMTFDEKDRLACHTKIVGSGAKVQVYSLFDYDSVKGDMAGT